MEGTLFLKSLHILTELFENRQKLDKNLYTEAKKKCMAYIENDLNISPDEKVIDFGKIRVIFDFNERWDVNHISQKKKLILENNNTDIKHYLFVLSKPNTLLHVGKPTFLLKYVKTQLHCSAEFFHIKELQYNVLKHIWVPYHEVITDENTKTKIMEDYSIKEWRQLPGILTSDPVVRFIGGQAGDFIKIIRRTGFPSQKDNTGQAGEHIIYRLCIETQ